MHQIWKTVVEVVDTQVIIVPIGSVFLSCQFQRGVICLWYVVGSMDNMPVVENRTIRIIGTGQDIDNYDNMKFIDTMQMDDFVWHVFEEM